MGNISKGKKKNVNYTINHSKYSSKSCKIDQKQAVHRDVSPSQIYITLNDNPSFTNNLTSAMSLKYKKIKMNNPANPGNTGNIPKKTNVNKQGIGFKQSINYNIDDIVLSNYPNLINPTSSYLPSQQYYVSSYDDDQVTQKIKLHKSRKRKFGSIKSKEFEFDANNMNQFDKKQPPKKRARIDMRQHSVFKVKHKGKGGRARNKNKGRNRGRTKNRNQYQYENHSTDCFDDEEDQDSDIDLSQSQTTTNSHHL